MIDFAHWDEGLVLNINKPLEWTSFDVVNKVRSRLSRHMGKKRIKVGHAGTLDPLADGVLVLCLGKATKRIEEIQGAEKEYLTDIFLGATRPSFDLETEIDERFPTDHITESLITEVLPQFIGKIQQIPPVFSAVKVKGKRAYELARRGEELVLAAKNIEIKHIEILKFELPLLTLKITCGKGTYIRALARDLGKALDSGAYLERLTRTRVGDFAIEHAATIDEFECFLENDQTFE